MALLCRLIGRGLNQYPVQTRTICTTLILKTDEIPPKPKRPLNKYMLYSGRIQHEIKKLHPDLPRKDFFRKIAEAYHSLGDDIKQELAEEYRANFEQFKKDYAEWDKLLTPELKALNAENKQEKKEAKGKTKLKKMIKELNKPKRPQSSNLLFQQTMQKPKDIPVPEWVKQVAVKWKALPKEEKAVFEEQYKAQSYDYQERLYNWEKEMFEQGLLELVRKGTLRKLS